MAVVSQDSVTVRRLRLAVGVLGMILPFVVTIGNAIHVGKPVLLGSISGSYYTEMRDWFVGTMFAIGVVLICYRYRSPDDALASIAGLAAIGVALFPTSPKNPDIMIAGADSTTGMLHGISATVLFVSLAIFCFFLFPRSATPGETSPRKKTRNAIYYTTGVIIIVGLGLAAFGSRLFPDLDAVRPHFWGESVAVFAFGIAWFTKSNLIFKCAED